MIWTPKEQKVKPTTDNIYRRSRTVVPIVKPMKLDDGRFALWERVRVHEYWFAHVGWQTESAMLTDPIDWWDGLMYVMGCTLVLLALTLVAVIVLNVMGVIT